MGDEGEPPDRPSSADEMVERIAKLLDCPADALLDEAAASLAVKGASELLSLWCEIASDDDRARLLDYARALVAAQTGPAPAPRGPAVE